MDPRKLPRTILDAFSIKNVMENSFKIRSPENMKFDANWLPTWTRNRGQNSLKIDAKTGIETDQENHEN